MNFYTIYLKGFGYYIESKNGKRVFTNCQSNAHRYFSNKNAENMAKKLGKDCIIYEY